MGISVDFAANQREAEEQGQLGSGGDFYKFKEGDNRFRLASVCVGHTSVFQGKKNFKWLCYVLDRRDGKVKVHFMPHKIYKAITALQQNPDYEFREVPMPYDLTVMAKNAGTKEVEYSVVPAKEVALTADEVEEIERQKPIAEVKQKLDEKAQRVGTTDGYSDVPHPADDSEPPF